MTKLGKINSEFNIFKLKSALTKNDAGDWGDDPVEGNATGILRSTNFTNQGILDLSDVAYRTLKPRKLAEKRLSAGEIIIERSGGSDSQPVGRIGFITPEIADNSYAFANFIQRIAVDDSIEPKYLYYCLQQMYEMGITASMQYQTTGIRNLDWKLYTKSILPKPRPKEQKAIATILSKVDEAIKVTENSTGAAEKLKKSLMQNLLTGKLKPDGSWRKVDEYYKDEKFGNVPVGWVVARVRDITNRVTDGEHLSPEFQDEGSYILSAEDIKDDGVSFDKAAHVRTEDCRRFRKRCDPDYGDVLIVSRGAGIGRTCKVNVRIDFCLMGSVILIKPNNEILRGGFLAQYFKSYNAWVELQKLSGTTAQQAIYLTHIKKVRLIYPKDSIEQDAISTVLEKFDNEIAGKKSKIDCLLKLKKSLMQNLLTGKVRVDMNKIENMLADATV